MPVPSLANALAANRESRSVEFKRELGLDTPGTWCELLKDIVAIANSGGGVIVIGLDDRGLPTGWDPGVLLAMDPADLTNKFSKYVGEDFDGFELAEASKGRRRLAIFVVDERVGAPLTFQRPGTYADEPGKQKTAFSRGTVYFRHGAKSEPGTSRDITKFVARELRRHRKEWNANLRRLANAPADSTVVVVSKTSGPKQRLDRFRIVDDPDAPALARTDFDITHPYRRKELLNEVNGRLGRKVVGPFEIQCVRKMYDIDAKAEFFHRPRFGSPQYSDAFVSWLIDEYQRDASFFSAAKSQAAARQQA